MEYFWKQQDDIPAGIGYPLFGTTHLMCVAVTAFVIAVLLMCFLRLDDKKQRLWQKAIPLFMVLLEASKILFLILVNRFGIGYLPLHICSIGIFIFLLREFLPSVREKEIMGEIAFVIIMPGAVMALLFADWTVYYPVLNFMNLYSYVWHGLLILYPLTLMTRGDIHPDIRHIHWQIIFLCIVVPPIYVFDRITGCNYFFVNRPVPGTPLSFFASFMGNPGYLLGYGVLTLAVILLVYLLVWFLGRIF